MLFIPNFLSAGGMSVEEQQSIDAVREFYGPKAAARTETWRELINRGQQQRWSENQSLQEVNDFFNRLLFIDDKKLWGKNDYWAIPLEFLGAAGGDCEDYSIAKYFSLRELGIREEKLRMVYVKALKYQQFHMVVAYYPTPSSVPLILDNIDGDIKPATRRPDLVPIFSFNGTSLWLMKERGQGQLAGSSSRLKLWSDLRGRFSTEQLRRPILNLDD